MNHLNIWVDKVKAAKLYEDDNNFSLIYSDEWKEVVGYEFSPYLNLNAETSGAAVRNFFSNLLPEGQVLEGLSKTYQVSKFDVFGILKKVGRDCAGALVLVDPDEVPEGWGNVVLDSYEKIEINELEDRIKDSQINETPIMFWKTTPRMSLAGVQNKLGVYLDEFNNIYIPKADAPTSHILKPDTVEGNEHEGIAANEYFCMQLAQAMKLNVPFTSYKKLTTPIYLVKRYDRIWTVEGKLVRTHQIDGCQALNLPPNLKYEREYPGSQQGASARDIFEISKMCSVPAVAQREVLQWIVFNYLIGNCDAHAKNISFLIDEIRIHKGELIVSKGMKVAPFYDLVCGTVYGYKEMAQSIGGEFEHAIVGGLEWKEFSNECGIKIEVVKKVVKNTLQALDKNLTIVAARVAKETESEIIEKVVGEIKLHKSYLMDSLFS
jgi:serine/threonine-protein kinase HipA